MNMPDHPAKIEAMPEGGFKATSHRGLRAFGDTKPTALENLLILIEKEQFLKEEQTA